MKPKPKKFIAILTILIIAFVVVIGGLSYAVATPITKRFTEFYILNSNNKACDYPSSLKIGEEGKVVVGIINQEHETTTYQVEIRVNGIFDNRMKPITLEYSEKWEETAYFIPDRAGDKQKVEFLLYKIGESNVYLTVYLWLDIQQKE